MEFERVAFGSITIDGKTYEHDVVVRLSGEIVKRKKKLSKEYFGTSQVLHLPGGMRAAYYWVRSNGQCASIAGSRSLFRDQAQQGPIAADTCGDPSVQRIEGKKIGLFHVTC